LIHFSTLYSEYFFKNSLPLSVLFSECKGEDRVIQPTQDVFASEGDTVTIDCQFETSMNPSLFWYRQEMGDFPKYMWKSYAGSSENALGISEFNVTINGKSVPLKIQKLQLTDSAVYYCALRPTVTGNTTTLTVKQWTWACTSVKASFELFTEITKRPKRTLNPESPVVLHTYT
uniref:Ig-like domain-containing protein n=1 Tax=Labrus bergylta TaxID=56723 RepID=A0A3Q3EPE7_9LABR